jgi:hypothetical protein
VVVLFEQPEQPPASAIGDVIAAVAAAGMEVLTLAIRDDLDAMVAGLRGKRPQIVLNLVRRFAGNPRLAPDVAAALDLLELPYTGATAAGLYLAADPELTAKLLHAFDIPSAAGAPPEGARDLQVAAVGNDRPTVLCADSARRDALGGFVAAAWNALRLRDYALLTVRVGPGNRPPALVSALPNPPLGRQDPFAEVCSAAGLAYDPLIAWILDEAWDRGFKALVTAKSA